MKTAIKGLLAATALITLPSMAQAAVIVSNVSISVPNNIDGVYINLVTGTTGTSGSAVPGWDINVYNNNGGLTFYGSASPAGFLATGTPGTSAEARALAEGTVIDSTGQYNQFQTRGTAFQAGGNFVAGFRFLNEVTGVLNYGYARLTTTAAVGDNAGFPATITQLVYENTGGAITVAAVEAAVPEPATWAMMIGGFGMIGFGARRSKRVATKVAYA